MAFTNPNKPSGLSPVGTLSGSNWTGKGRWYAIPTTDSTNNFFPGDLVSLIAGGSSGGDTTTGYPYVSLTAAGAAAVGVIQAVGTTPYGPPIDPNNLARTYAPITKAVKYYAYVLDDPGIIWEIQEGGTGTNLTAGCLGSNANILLGAASTAATPTNYVSQTVMTDTAAPTTTSTLNLKIISFAQRPDNHFVTSPATGGGSQKWWVLINNHSYRGGIVSI